MNNIYYVFNFLFTCVTIEFFFTNLEQPEGGLNNKSYNKKQISQIWVNSFMMKSSGFNAGQLLNKHSLL